MLAIGVDIGGTHLRTGCVDERFALTGFTQKPTKDILTGDAPAALARFIGDYIKRFAGGETVSGVCVGFPAAVDRNRAVVLSAPNVPGFDGLDLKATLQEALGVPVIVERDVNLLLTYDIYRHSVPRDAPVIGYYVGTGLGNTILINGRLLTGHNGVAGELGHIPAWDKTHPCTCGNTGCVEELVAGKALAALRAAYYPDTDIADLFVRHGAEPRVGEYIRHLAIPVAIEVNIIDPSTVILGGGVIAMRGFPREKLIEAIKFHARKPQPCGNLTFIFSDNGQQNGVIGAGITMLKGADAL